MTTLVIDDPAPFVRRFTLARPERMNALDGATLRALNNAVRDCVAAGDAVKVMIIRGTGRAFCAGNDLKWLAEGVLHDRAAHMRHQDLMGDTFARMEAAPQVVIGSINGFAVAGGFELALACDLLIADEEAQIGDEHMRRNLMPSGGSSQRLPRRIGLHQAMYYLLTGRRMTGREAVACGLAVDAVPGDQLDAATLALAEELAQADAMALATMKALARRSVELPLQDGLQYERWMQFRYRTQSPSMEAGVHAFADKTETRR